MRTGWLFLYCRITSDKRRLTIKCYHVRSNIKIWLKGALILEFILRDLVIPICQGWTYGTWDSTIKAEF